MSYPQALLLALFEELEAELENIRTKLWILRDAVIQAEVDEGEAK